MEVLRETTKTSAAVELEAIWDANNMHAFHPAIEAGIMAIDEQLVTPDASVSNLYFTDVTLRDGQQQQTNEVTEAQRIEVFDNIVSTGVDRIEIGHLGNKNGDQQLAAALVRHIAEKEATDELYAKVKIQVLFGSQEKEIQEGSQILQDAFRENYPETWEEEIAQRVVVHVYDRVDSALLGTASEPYSIKDSAFRVSVAAAHTLAAGFKNFSISGEATTAVTPEESIQFYRTITTRLLENGAETVNINLPNTYGYSANHDWNTATMAAFDAAVKYGFEDRVSTSIHTHNDVDNAIGFSMNAVVAGIDRVEGTLIGVGERTGNAANIDVMARVLEQARHQLIREEREDARFSGIAEHAGAIMLQRTVAVGPDIAANLKNWYPVGQKLAEIFGPHAEYRWHRTAVGNPYAHDNGSGPHDQAMAAAILDPIKHPGDSHYEWALLINNALGRPDTQAIAIGDPEAVDQITVGNYAGGGKTLAIKQGTLKRAAPEHVKTAKLEFEFRKGQLLGAIQKGVELISG